MTAIGFEPLDVIKPGTCDSRVCRQCQAGKYQPVVGEEQCGACKVCPCGKWSNNGAEVCTPSTCEAGTQGTTNPVLRVTPKSGCEICPAGQFQPVTTSLCKVCQQCGEGKFTDGKQKWRACGDQRCPKGHEFSSPPPVGGAKFSSHGCKKCACGRYQPEDESTSICLSYTCPSGQAPSGMGRVDAVSGCANCTAGMFVADSDVNQCRVCVACPCGTWSQSGANLCRAMSCPAGTFPQGQKSTSPTGACAPCPEFRFSDRLVPGNSNCSVQCRMCPVATLRDNSGSVTIGLAPSPSSAIATDGTSTTGSTSGVVPGGGGGGGTTSGGGGGGGTSGGGGGGASSGGGAGGTSSSTTGASTAAGGGTTASNAPSPGQHSVTVTVNAAETVGGGSGGSGAAKRGCLVIAVAVALWQLPLDWVGEEGQWG